MRTTIPAHLINTPEPEKTKNSRIAARLKSEIVFGSPGYGCKGTGVCKVLPASVSGAQDWKCPHGTAWVILQDTGKVRIEFLKSALTKKMITRYFRWGLFQVFDPYVLPLYYQRRLGTNHPLVIMPGIYSVLETDKYIIVDF